MYIPSYTRVKDRGLVDRFLHAHGFAIVVTNKDGVPSASHLPVLLEKDRGELGVLRSHMAKANPQWRHFETQGEVLCIFHGPHSYITPSWYEMQHTVPTWNYGAVHVYGRAKIVDHAAARATVIDTTEKYESGRAVPWQLPLTDQELSAMLKAIVAFEIEITRVEAKFKLGQNRSREDQDGMLRGLKASTDIDAQQLAKFIEEYRETER